MTHRSRYTFLIFLVLPMALAGLARAQTATYHLHQEASSTSGLFQLKSAGPDTASAPVQSAQLRNLAPGEYVVKQFDTQAGVPGLAGAIGAGATVTFTLWMKKTDNFGTMFPRAKLNMNSAGGASLCTATGSAALTTTLVQYSLSCTVGTAITMTAADRFYLWTGVNMTVGPGNKNVNAELDIEGTLNGNYDSQIVVPLPFPAPSITSLNPSSGEIGAPVTISGSNFGATQGGSTVTFNGTQAVPSNWSASSIIAPVPPGATPGPVVVTVSGATSNGVTFTAIVATLSGTISRSSDALAVNAALVEALQAGAVKASATSSGSGAYSMSGLATGTYDIRVTATGYQTSVTSGVALTAGSTSTVNVALNTGPPITYSYDELGRLTGVVDSSGESAKYTYDAVGNVLSIARTAAGQVSILQFTPNQGLVGASVTISGSGFSATASQNTVQFNGVAASVTSASATQIVTSVPSGATTGTIIVTAPAGSASSNAPFVVASDITASITAGGPPVVIAIPAIGQVARVTFAGTAGQTFTLDISGLTIPQSDISVSNPDGSTLVAPTLVTIGGVDAIEVASLPATGTYTILVDPRGAYTGSLALQYVMDLVAPITAGGPAVNVNLLPRQNARLTFSGTAGQRVSVRMTGITIAQGNASILNPDGTTLNGPVAVTNVNNDGFVDATTLPASGTYTFLLDPQGSSAGRASVSLYSVVDATGVITVGGPTVGLPTTTPGQNVRLTFSGTAGQKIQVTVGMTSSEPNPFSALMTLLDPNNTQLTSVLTFSTQCHPTNCDNSFSSNNVLQMTLPSGGTHTIVLDPRESYTGNNSFWITIVP